MSKIKKEVVLNDIHFPNHNKKAVSCALQAIAQLKPDTVTLNGDIMDCGTFSRHDRFKSPKCHWTDSQYYTASLPEYEATETFLNAIDKCNPKHKRFMLGNHEVWLDDFISESPKTRRDLFSLQTRLELKERGYKIYPYNSYLQSGKLYITHGFHTGINHSRKHLLDMGNSILYGHCHSIEVTSKITPNHISHMAWANGCLCDMNPAYLRNRPQSWNHGFAIVYIWPSGEFQVDLIRIQNGKCVVEGKEIKG